MQGRVSQDLSLSSSREAVSLSRAPKVDEYHHRNGDSGILSIHFTCRNVVFGYFQKLGLRIFFRVHFESRNRERKPRITLQCPPNTLNMEFGPEIRLF